jgi:hypothetical protein
LNQKPELSINSIVEPTDWFIEHLKFSEKRNFAALHIRRGDYAQSMNRINGMLSMEYFLNISRLLPVDLEIFIFTYSPNEDFNELGTPLL